jgi:hypothetical protein
VRPQLARPFCALWLLAVWVTPLAAQKWQVQYFYDKAKSGFVIADLQFPSATRGVAVGVIMEGKSQQPTSVVTSDGGAHWQTIPLKEPPVSLFFLNESNGWLVTTKGLWRTVEAGKTWTKLPKVPGQIFRVYFLDENHGWAVGPKKTALETQDGGKTWKPLGVNAAQYGEDIHYSAYTYIAFATPKIGLITGWNIPPRHFGPRLPDWVDPESTLRQREPPHMSYTLATADGGANWTPSAGSLFGTVARIRFAPNGKGLGLMEYGAAFHYPSEVYSIAWPTGATHTVYRETNFAVSDIWLASDGTAYLAGTQVRGQLRSLIPSKVQVLTSRDLQNWTPIPVDYRAEATGVVVAGADDDHLWLATNTGMILKLVR